MRYAILLILFLLPVNPALACSSEWNCWDSYDAGAPAWYERDQFREPERFETRSDALFHESQARKEAEREIRRLRALRQVEQGEKRD